MVMTYPAVRMPKLKPAHPGEILREDVLPSLKISVVEVARTLGVSRQLLHGVMAGRAGVSADTALRLGRYFSNSPQFWLNLQGQFDIAMAERKHGEDIKKRVHPANAACV